MACLYCDAAEATALIAPLGGTAAVPVFWGQGGGAKELGPREKGWKKMEGKRLRHRRNLGKMCGFMGKTSKFFGRDGWKMGAGVT